MTAPSLAAELALLQITDSLFPSGTFTHSYGLEQLAREGIVVSAADVEAYVGSVLTLSVATVDAPAAVAAARAALRGDIDAIVEVDRALYRRKTAAELRAASLATGRRMVEETSIHVDAAILARYASAVRADATLGCQPVAFGVVCGALGVAPVDVAPALMFGAVNAMLQAAQRLLRVSHRDVQAILHRLRPEIAALAADIDADGASPQLKAFHPLQEIASMRHALAAARLFAS